MSCRPCQGWHAFLQSPGRWMKVSCHDKLSRWRGPDKWAGFVMLHLNCPDGEQKTYLPVGRQGTSASARQPKDAVPGDETVRVPQYL